MILIYKFNLINSLLEFSKSSSNWTFREILYQDISVNLYFPLSFVVRLPCYVLSTVWIISVLGLVYPPLLSISLLSFLHTAYMLFFISISQGNFCNRLALCCWQLRRVSLAPQPGKQNCYCLPNAVMDQ